MKRTITLLLISVLLVSCVDPICRKYMATVSIKNIHMQEYSCLVVLNDPENKEIIVASLNQDNKFSDVYKPWRMGDQLDLRYPEKYGDEELQKVLGQIVIGGIYKVYEILDGNRMLKYTIECTPEDVKETIDDRLYRCYEISLDWNKRVPIAE